MEACRLRGSLAEELSLYVRVRPQVKATRWLSMLERCMKTTVQLELESCVQARLDDSEYKWAHKSSIHLNNLYQLFQRAVLSYSFLSLLIHAYSFKCVLWLALRYLDDDTQIRVSGIYLNFHTFTVLHKNVFDLVNTIKYNQSRCYFHQV